MGCEHCNSTKSFKGAKGDSAYLDWLSEGNSGTKADFLASLIGAAGVNGIYLLHNDTTQTDNSSGALQDLMTYDLENANTSLYPFEDGDVLEIEGRFTSDGLNTVKLIELEFDGNALIPQPVLMNGVNAQELKIKATVTRVSATEIYSEGEVNWFNGSTGFPNTPAATNWYSSLITVSNMNTADTEIKTTGDGATAADITQQYFRIKLVKNITNL